jgi:hypothetical protein
LAAMTDVRIEMQSTLMSDDTRAYHSLLKFTIEVLRAENLKILSVQWRASSRPVSTGRKAYCNHVVRLLRNRALERKSEGGRGSSEASGAGKGLAVGPAFHPGSWARREVELQR